MKITESTLLDLFVTDEAGKVIGRPWLILEVDMETRLVVKKRLSLKIPNPKEGPPVMSPSMKGFIERHFAHLNYQISKLKSQISYKELQEFINKI